MLQSRATKLPALALATALAAGAAAAPVLAAQQGTLGTSSTGVANITLVKNALYRVTNIQDFVFSSWTGQTLRAENELCVYSSAGLSYRITATGSGTGGAFQLTNGGGDTITYQVDGFPIPELIDLMGTGFDSPTGPFGFDTPDGQGLASTDSTASWTACPASS